MARQQTKKPQPSTSSSHSRPHKPKPKAHSHPSSHPSDSPHPSISKLKSSLRQTRRLLARPVLDASKKRDAERRLAQLERELRDALEGERERKMVARYRMVRFFERRKVERALRRALRRLGDLTTLNEKEAGKEGEKERKKRKKERKALEEELLERRVDLNYVLYYPKTKKYISLLKPTTPEAEAERYKVRESIRGAMEKGELPSEPEVESKHKNVNSSVLDGPVGKRQKTSERKVNGGHQKKEEAQEEEDDGFFEAGSEADEEEQEAEEEEEADETHELEDAEDEEMEDDDDDDDDDEDEESE